MRDVVCLLLHIGELASVRLIIKGANLQREIGVETEVRRVRDIIANVLIAHLPFLG